MSWRHLDESDVRVRPNPRGSRRRTKERPAHEEAVPGFVLAVDRGRYAVLLGGRGVEYAAGDVKSRRRGPPLGPQRVVTAMKARELGRKSVVVGDDVALVGDTTGSPDALARIVRVEPRRSALRRSPDDTDTVERVVVANADQLVVVCSLANPEPRPRFVDRCLVAAFDAGLDPLLVLTKADLQLPEEFLATYAPLDVPYVVTAWEGTSRQLAGEHTEAAAFAGVEQLAERLAGRVSVLIGQSGVGKSTLVNRLVPQARRATGDVNAVTGRGRHTSSSAVALRLPAAAGWVIDTPGVRSFGLGHVEAARIVDHFPDLASGTQGCPRGCTHDEPECGLDAFVAAGAAGAGGPARLDSLRRLLRARAGGVED